MTIEGNTGGLIAELTGLLDQFASTATSNRSDLRDRVFSCVVKLLEGPDLIDSVYALAPRFDDCHLFADSDWDYPHTLQASLVRGSLFDEPATTAIEVLSELRLLAVAKGRAEHPELDAGQARRFLEEVLAQNLDLLFPESTEVARESWTPLLGGVHRVFELLVAELGTRSIMPRLVCEAEAMLEQRPIMVHRVTDMLEAAHRGLDRPDNPEMVSRAERLFRAWHGPTELSGQIEDAESYEQALSALTAEALLEEADQLARSMRDTGLVCPRHAILLRMASQQKSQQLVCRTLALDSVGRDCLDAYDALMYRLIEVAVYPSTAQCLLGLAELLERGVLFFPPVGPSLWRLIDLPLMPTVAEALLESIPHTDPPDPAAILLSGAISVLGLPLGVGQGNNPTCQSARAISLWAQCDPGFLLEVVANAARDGYVDLHFEGALLRSCDLPAGLVDELHTELDPVSLVLVPHLDRIYGAMGRRAAGREQDEHRWINPEFHGWWVWRGFATVLQFGTGDVIDFEGFMRRFFAAYHPDYNGGHTLIYPQPAGIAATDPQGGLVGWHAVAIERVTLDDEDRMRVYFFDPNNEGRQDWGRGVVTSTSGHQELSGESSLLFEDFAARLYLFHYQPVEVGDPSGVDAEAVARVAAAARESWAANLAWRALVPT